MYTDEPERRFVPGAVFELQVPTGTPWHGKSLELIELRWYNSHAVAFFKDVPDRAVAESLIKAILWINQDPSELPVEDDAWYDYQLVGLGVIRDGERIGTVARVDHFPAQDLLLVRTVDSEVLVPFVKAMVPSVDIEAGTLTITPPPGLFEEVDDEPVEQVEPVEPVEPEQPADVNAPVESVAPVQPEKPSESMS